MDDINRLIKLMVPIMTETATQYMTTIILRDWLHYRPTIMEEINRFLQYWLRDLILWQQFIIRSRFYQEKDNQ